MYGGVVCRARTWKCWRNKFAKIWWPELREIGRSSLPMEHSVLATLRKNIGPVSEWSSRYAVVVCLHPATKRWVMIQLGTQQNPEVWWCGKSSGSHLQPQTIWKRRKLRFLLVSFLSKTTLLTSSSWKTLNNYCMNSGPSGSEFTFDGPKTGLPFVTGKNVFFSRGEGSRCCNPRPRGPEFTVRSGIGTRVRGSNTWHG